MIINKNAIEYMNKNSKKELFIIPVSKVNEACCTVDFGNPVYIEPVFAFESKDKDKFKLIHDDQVKIYITKTLETAIDENSELIYKKGIFGGEFKIKNFYGDRIEKVDLLD